MHTDCNEKREAQGQEQGGIGFKELESSLMVGSASTPPSGTVVCRMTDCLSASVATSGSFRMQRVFRQLFLGVASWNTDCVI